MKGKDIYKAIKNLIHNEFKITKFEINNIIRLSCKPVIDSCVKNEIKKQIDNKINNSNIFEINLRKLVDEKISDIYNNKHYCYSPISNKENYINKLVIDAVNKRADEILSDLITPEKIYEILQERFKLKQ